MRKWLTIGGVLMLLAWSPFLWKELTSSPAEKKGRDLPGEDVAADPETAAAGAPAAEPAEPEPEAPAELEKTAPAAAADPNAKPADLAKAAKAEPEQPGDPEGDNPDEEQGEEPPPPVQAAGPTSVLKDAFDTQTRDALWAKDSEARIGAMFSGDVPAEMLQNASCRKAVCRLQLRWTRERAEAYVSVYQSLHQQFGPEVGVEPIGEPDSDDGHQQVDIYVARKGYTIADLAK